MRLGYRYGSAASRSPSPTTVAERDFPTAAIVLDDGRISVGGYIWKEGENTPLVGFRILDQQFIDSVVPVSSVLELTDKKGVIHILRGRAGPVVPLPFVDEKGGISVLAQSFGEYELDGVKGGYGTYETLRVARS